MSWFRLEAPILLASVMVMTGSTPAVEIVAHRGASHDAPENTLAAVKLAWERDADGVEVDVYLTKDGRIAVLHDKTTKRTTGVDRPVAEMTLSEVRELDAGSWKDPRWKGERIPSLEEVLDLFPPGKKMYVEVKCGPEIVPELERVLKATGRIGKGLVVIGFGLETVRAIKERMPALTVYWLSGWEKDKETGRWLTRMEDLVANARKAGVDGLSVAADGPIDRAAVQLIRDAGLEFHVWTVDDPDVARRMRALGVDSITTNRPAWLRERLAESLPAAPSSVSVKSASSP